jgi:hypothetical protein
VNEKEKQPEEELSPNKLKKSISKEEAILNTTNKILTKRQMTTTTLTSPFILLLATC